MRARWVLVGALVSVLALPVGARAASAPCTASGSALTCLNSFPTASVVSAAIASAHATVAMPSSTSPTLSYLASPTTGPKSFFMPTGRCNQIAQMANASPPSIKDCTFGSASAPSARTMVLTGDSRAVMWASSMATIATVAKWRLVVLAKPGCVAQSGSITYLNGVGQPGPWVACDTFRTTVQRYLGTLHPALVIVATNPVAQLATGRSTAGNARLLHDNSLSYLTTLKKATPSSQFVEMTGFPLVVHVASGTASPVDCLATHKTDVRFCDVRPNNGAVDTDNAALESAARDAGVSVINETAWLCNVTCPAVIDGKIPYDRDGMHMNNVYTAWLTGVLWRSLGALPSSPLAVPN